MPPLQICSFRAENPVIEQLRAPEADKKQQKNRVFADFRQFLQSFGIAQRDHFRPCQGLGGNEIRDRFFKLGDIGHTAGDQPSGLIERLRNDRRSRPLAGLR